MKFVKIILIAIVILLAALVIFKDDVIRLTVNQVGSSIIGAPLNVGSFSWNPFTQKIRLANVRLYNPPGFPNEPMVDISRIDVDYDFQSLIKKKMYFPYINIDLKETVIIRNKEGKLNVDSLKVAQKKDDEKAEATKTPEQKTPDVELSIDVMKLNVERTVFIDYSKGEKPVIKKFNVGLKNKTFKNIKSVRQLVSVILIQGMAPAAIKGAAIYTAASFLGTALFPVGAVAGVLHHIDQKLSNSNSGPKN